jgi:hypothetical protein
VSGHGAVAVDAFRCFTFEGTCPPWQNALTRTQARCRAPVAGPTWPLRVRLKEGLGLTRHLRGG